MVEFLELLTLGLVLGIFGLLVDGLRRRHPGLVVNAVLVIVVVLLPFAIGMIPTPPPRTDLLLPALLAAAGFLHLVGMAGAYDTLWWWDHLTHGFSAGLLAMMIYALLLLDPLSISRSIGGVLTVAFTGFFGLAWELVERTFRRFVRHYDYPDLLVIYGRWDTSLDLLVDLVAAVAVVVLDIRIMGPVVAKKPQVVTGLLVVGTVFGLVILGVNGLWYSREIGGLDGG